MVEIGLGLALATLGAALAVALPGTGSAIGTRIVGQAGAGVATESPEKFGMILLLQALPGTQGIYGLLTGFLVIMGIGLLSGLQPVGAAQGLAILFACLPVAIAGGLSAPAQGMVAAAGVSLIAKRPEEVGKAIIFAAMVETFAVFGLLASILLLRGVL
ncbi:MAG: V-type ATP synthase subunit K [Methanocellales archaeon]|nr:V-type ATP synthase subunit K [Methanocellales archaeon]MDD3292225.1 V-type ATP synthase subunit K [Methanocellales archaeon]MDD5234789.1 V-type ATP synthase subunit K [Methanocellales archaeon]MDD5484841.1 V-type ATP synthase subunit K [Methanocellales archaeon]